MAVRVVSALVAAAILLSLAWVGGWWFGALAFFVMFVCFWEFFGITLPGDMPSRLFGVACGLGVSLALLSGSMTEEVGLLVLVAAIVLPCLWFLVRTGDIDTVAARIGLFVAGLLWIGVLGSMTSSLALLEEGFAWLVLAAVLSFGSDIGGYFVGSAFGRTKLYKKVSPKKTWEGAVGGVVVATAMAFGERALVGPSLEVYQLAVLAPLGAAFGQLGDLAESMLKRSVKVKDSGAIMPGHGGLFDRIDALLFVGPVLFLYARLGLGVPIDWLAL